MRRVIYGCFVLVLVVVTSSGFFAPKYAVTKVGSEYITETDIDKRLEIEFPNNVDARNATQNRQIVLGHLVNESILLQSAKKEGYARTDSFKSQVDLAKKQLLITQLVKDKIVSNIQVEETDVRSFFDQNVHRFGPFESRRLSHILSKSKKDSSRILRDLRKGKSFAKLAKTHSVHEASAQNGGDIGAYQKKDLIGDFEPIGKAAFRLKKKGDFTEVIQSPLGFHIIKLTDVIKRPALKYDQVKQDIYTALVTDRRRQLTEDYIEKAKETIKVKKLNKD